MQQQQQQQQQLQQQQLQQQQLQQQHPVLQPIVTIENIYDPQSADCRFRSVFYNLVNPADIPKLGKPSVVDAAKWDQAVKNNPSPTKLFPTQATGFSDLLKRIDAQTKTTQQHIDALNNIEKCLQQLEQRNRQTNQQIEQFKQNSIVISDRILKIMSKLEVSAGNGQPISSQEESFQRKLEHLNAELNKPTQSKSKLNELISLNTVYHSNSSTPPFHLSDANKASVYQYLQQQEGALRCIVDALKHTIQDTEILLKEYSQSLQG